MRHPSRHQPGLAPAPSVLSRCWRFQISNWNLVIYCCWAFVVSLVVLWWTPALSGTSRIFNRSDIDLTKLYHSDDVKDKELFIVLVLSARNSFDKREGIRLTWVKHTGRYVFLIGDEPCSIPPKYRKEWTCSLANASIPVPPLEQEVYDFTMQTESALLAREATLHNDIALLPMVDYYRALPHKVKLGFRWALQHAQAQWVVKTDDDSYFVASEADKLFSTLDPTEMTVVGHIEREEKVAHSGKWAEYSEYQSKFYPPFPNGAGYVVSSGVAQYIADYDGFEYQGEDVSVGIWLNESASTVTWLHSDLFVTDGDCTNTSRIVIGHNISPLKMRQCYAVNYLGKTAAQVGLYLYETQVTAAASPIKLEEEVTPQNETCVCSKGASSPGKLDEGATKRNRNSTAVHKAM